MAKTASLLCATFAYLNILFLSNYLLWLSLIFLFIDYKIGKLWTLIRLSVFRPQVLLKCVVIEKIWAEIEVRNLCKSVSKDELLLDDSYYTDVV